MSRLDTMARFAEPGDKEPQVLAFCHNCVEALEEGTEVAKFEAETFCDMDCLKQFYDIKEITLEAE